jgi:morphogenetic protein associated with SpoVID
VKIHIVKKGETLHDIANKYNVDLEKLIELNASAIPDPDQIQPGQKVKIPSAPVPLPQPVGEIVHKHVVVQGDSLWKLSQEWDVPLKALIDANPHLKNPNVLMTGEIVYIPKIGTDSPHGSAPDAAVQGGKVSTAPIAGPEGMQTDEVEVAPSLSEVPQWPGLQQPYMPDIPGMTETEEPLEQMIVQESGEELFLQYDVPAQEAAMTGDLPVPQTQAQAQAYDIPEAGYDTYSKAEWTAPHWGMMPAQAPEAAYGWNMQSFPSGPMMGQMPMPQGTFQPIAHQKYPGISETSAMPCSGKTAEWMPAQTLPAYAPPMMPAQFMPGHMMQLPFQPFMAAPYPPYMHPGHAGLAKPCKCHEGFVPAPYAREQRAPMQPAQLAAGSPHADWIQASRWEQDEGKAHINSDLETGEIQPESWDKTKKSEERKSKAVISVKKKTVRPKAAAEKQRKKENYPWINI